MIAEELRSLRKYINSECKASCGIGAADLSPDDYPYVQIIPIRPVMIHYDNRQLALVNMLVDLKISVARSNEIKAMEVFERLLKKINQFNYHKGHEIEDASEAVPEYDEENTTYTITVPYMLRLRVQDS